MTTSDREAEYPPAKGLRLQYGVLLPHFGRHASRDRLLAGGQQAEQYGFDSVWVRDHIVFHPHEHEDPSRTHVDPFVVLSAIAAVTTRITLAMGTLIPHRHPVHTALLLGSLEFMAGPDRVLVGFGLGTYQHEFEVIGMGDVDRRELIEEQVAIMRRLWSGKEVDWKGKSYQFEGVDVHPVPGDRDGSTIPIWYGGNSPAAVRRAVEYCDGWIPGRIPLKDYRSRIERMRRLAEKAGKPVPEAGNIPLTVPARTVEEGVRTIDMPNLLKEATKQYEPPGPDGFQTVEDLTGAVLVGPSERLVEGVRRCQEAGTRHFVFDMRTRFANWEECLQIIGDEVLPLLHRGDGRV